MKKEEIVAALDGIKNMTSVVSIHSMLEMLEKMEPEVRVEKVFGITQELADKIAGRIERCIDNNSDNLVELDSACFELSYQNQIELTDVNVNVYDIMNHITACIDEFVVEEDEEEAEEDMTFAREEDDTLNEAWSFPRGEDEAPYEINDNVFIEGAGGTMDNEMS
jgi:hypothetical protein